MEEEAQEGQPSVRNLFATMRTKSRIYACTFYTIYIANACAPETRVHPTQSTPENHDDAASNVAALLLLCCCWLVVGSK